MTTFQWVTLTVLTCLTVSEAAGWLRGRRGMLPLFRTLIWLAAAVAVAEPVVVQWLAGLLGIGRGADALLYLFVLTFIGTSFYFYSRQMRLRREITQLVRHIALTEVRRGALGAEDARP